MAADNPRIPLINLNVTGTNVKYTELRNEVPSLTKTDAHQSSSSQMTTISIPTNTVVHNENITLPISPTSPTQTSVNDYELHRLPIQQRRFIKKSMMSNVGYRLAKRKDLHIRRRITNDIMCAIALLGIFLMITENELTFNRVDHKDTTISLLIKATITFTTIILTGFVFYYHRLDISLYCVDNSIDDWRIALTRSKLFLIILEAFVCAIHPIPGHFLVEWGSQYVHGYISLHPNPYQSPQLFPSMDNSTTMMNRDDSSALPSGSYVPIDVMLSLPMFFRLYLLCRFIMLRSHLVRDASSQSLGYLNRVSFNFQFVIKAYIKQSPAFSLMSFCIITFFIASWSLRACDYNVKTGHMPMLDALWLFIVTFTTIGYGDIVPSTYCGRGIAAISGLIGVFATALLVAVISQKLELTRSEKYVHNFVTNIELAKKHRHQAANVVKYGWKIWYLKRRGKEMFIEYIKAQRKLLTAIHCIRKIKQEQRKLGDNAITLSELHNSQKIINLTTNDVSQQVLNMERKVDGIEDRLITMGINLQSMHDTMNILMDKLNR
ncbi:unnamed protein product [Didymodactylos carnosus]|uniref:Calmodulin-binding domain-containing protein n=1 Tax=Didymodactylos carnosus TaxID=1234261 RepID=A0A814GFJ9_9BILA|nr:unnamed protein product [Didymodactylos carnosus]CAF0995647.1 unnamed protein product [Didymodactylos carnosus]CAF3558492.1 unnamed protein product [Didymodactylos carnosus]CAF3767294.1 unnamed protein product [Didymodactylos carnosus]